MPKGYWIAHITVTDPDLYPEYIKLDNPVIAEYGGVFLVRGGQCEAPESPQRDRHVVIEFKDYETARACYYSAGYQEAAKIRQRAAESDVIIVEGHA
ncbi:DUF1330 domain-containing protein [Paracoccaceae bacterium GXU_MW_L88]